MKDCIKQAVAIQKGKKCKIGATVAIETDPICYRLLRYENWEAVVDDNKGGEKRFPQDEIFDVNKVKDIAIEINTFGNYRPEERMMINL